MDLRTIMNSDAAGASDTASAPPILPPPSISRQASMSDATQEHLPHAASVPNTAYQSRYPTRPLQPPPLQPRYASPEYSLLQSPYQSAPVSASSTGARSQRPQSPRASAPFTPGSRESYSATLTGTLYNYPPQQAQQHHSSISLTSPYNPGPMSAGVQQPDSQSYFSQSRSYSAQESPHSVASQPIPVQQLSPAAQRSVPGTPSGPPSSLYSRTSPQSAPRPPSSGYDYPAHRISSPWAGPDSQIHSQRQMRSPSERPKTYRHDPGPVDHPPRNDSTDVDRQRSNSVSPKTILAMSTRGAAGGGPLERSVSPQRHPSEDRIPKDSPGSSVPVSVSNAGHSGSNLFPARPPIHRLTPSQTASSAEGLATNHNHSAAPHTMDRSPNHMHNSISNPHPPKRKKIHYDEPPIFARRSIRTKGRCPMIPNPHPPIPKHSRQARLSSWAFQKQSPTHAASVSAPTPGFKSQPDQVLATNGPPLAALPPEPAPTGPLGPWEPSITGYIPHEEITKLICDFLFQHVVMRTDVTAESTGTATKRQGVVVEVEAKFGQIIDEDRGERLRLPVLTESVVSREDPRIRTSFESSMSLAQHRAMNNFLNEMIKASMPQSNPGRIPLSYAHKKERDTFYDVSLSDLPPVLRQNFNPRHTPKVRVTTDQRTGEVIAKIVKCRIADLEVYSPRTSVDWRISVNLEIDYDGDVRQLSVSDGSKGGVGRNVERNKDRMSYRHLAYQIDLTQVGKSEPPGKSDFEHELEIEVSAAEIRRQGHLVMAGDPKNQYEDLIKGFVDNVRVLARAVPP